MRKLRMTKAHSLAIAGAAGTLLVMPGIGAAANDASALEAKYNCMACHAVNNKIVGPSYKEVAAKYAGDPGAVAKLEQKVKSGGSGVWGAIPMPPNNVPDPDLQAMVESILATK